jgi:hypothetical protein
LCALAIVASACGPQSVPTEAEPEPAISQPAAEPDPCDAPFDDWRYERIALPPEFAPTLPRGVEHLYFAPGMFEPASPGYWTYVFLLELEAPLADTEAVEALLTVYYQGLVTAVARSTKKGSTHLVVALDPPVDEVWRGRLELDDVFVTGNRLKLELAVSSAESRIAVAVGRAGAEPMPHLDDHRRCLLVRGPPAATAEPQGADSAK